MVALTNPALETETGGLLEVWGHPGPPAFSVHSNSPPEKSYAFLLLFTCLYVCGMYGCVPSCSIVCGRSVFLVAFPASLKCALSQNLELANSSLTSWAASGDPCVLSEALGLQGGVAELAWLNVGAGDPNSGPDAYIVGKLSTEPSPQPQETFPNLTHRNYALTLLSPWGYFILLS